MGSGNGGQRQEEVGGIRGFKSVVQSRCGQSRAPQSPYSCSVRMTTAAADGTEEGGLGPRGSCTLGHGMTIKGTGGTKMEQGEVGNYLGARTH